MNTEFEKVKTDEFRIKVGRELDAYIQDYRNAPKSGVAVKLPSKGGRVLAIEKLYTEAHNQHLRTVLERLKAQSTTGNAPFVYERFINAEIAKLENNHE